MKGEADRECRARGGHVKKQSRSNVEREFRGAHPKGTPDASLSRGGGPLFRKRGGKIPPQFEARDEDEERDEKAAGGAIAGGAKRPNLGRAGRARGGGVGSDLSPLTSAHKPARPKQRHLMPDTDRTP